MNRFSILCFFAFSLIFFNACQKELNFDYSVQSFGTLKSDSTTSECLPSSVHGTFYIDSALNTSNYIDVQVDVSAIGIYEIESDTVNGFSFKGTGTFGNTGINTVRLYANGIPQLSGTTTFIISYLNNNSQCVIDVDVITTGGTQQAVYTFGGAGAGCTGVNLTGTYMSGLQMSSNNTASVNLTVSAPGNYSMSTPVINGVSFSSSGVIAMGATGVTLTATGTPLAAGTFNFPISGAGSGCSFSVTFDQPAPPAAFTLGGAPNSCTGAILSGTYTSGVPVNASNYVTITVNVTNAGSYSIATSTIVGMSFSATGLFTTTGPQNVILYASGTPDNSGSYLFPVNHNSETCTFSVSIAGPPTNFITCNMDGVFTTFNVNASAGLDNSTGFPILSIDGSSSASSINPSINLGIVKSMGGSITAGNYDVNQAAVGITLNCNFINNANVTYLAVTDPQNQNQNPPFTIVISSISANRVVGTFSGQIKDNNGAGPGVIVVSQGIFNVPIQ